MPAPSGIIIIDKPRGPSSMHVCANIRWRLRAAGAPKNIKVGHGGTLDPLATGVLVVLVGKATPLCNAVMAGAKEYLTDIDLSALSTTDDAEGDLTPVPVDHPPDRPALEHAAARFVGTIMQTPPAYSAIKIDGRRAYDIARRHGTDALTDRLKPRPVRVDACEILHYEWPSLRLRVACGKGTYIRSLARDLGAVVGAGGYLTALRRTRVGRWTIDQARSLDALPDTLTQADLLPVPPTGEIDPTTAPAPHATPDA
ncbi:MAG: tRNA pseudouridine(55) synthase TruB [Phycisphaeraceae bacterium]|nr:MAG: tRNA pseudouridine(55) synthase TruB [Phycisphaeraceae bacterium]